MPREILWIDEDKCDGCGQCVPSCHEGALAIVNGKAKLVADILCDGLGACLGECPRGALRIEKREAEAFDEEAVRAHLEQKRKQAEGLPIVAPPVEMAAHRGCPSSQFVRSSPRTPPAGNPSAQFELERSELTHWPVQLRLLHPSAPQLQGARLLLSAVCVPVAFPGFHRELLRGRAVALACPKLDDSRAHLEKLSQMIRRNDLLEVTVAHMQVPCCSGLLMMALEARRVSGRDVPIDEVVIGTQGEVLSRREVSARHA